MSRVSAARPLRSSRSSAPSGSWRPLAVSAVWQGRCLAVCAVWQFAPSRLRAVRHFDRVVKRRRPPRQPGRASVWTGPHTLVATWLVLQSTSSRAQLAPTTSASNESRDVKRPPTPPLRVGMLRSALCVAQLVLLGACCTDELVSFAIDVQLVDAVTGAPPATEVLLVVKDGSFLDSLRVSPPWPATGAWASAALGRSGTYTVEVSAAGYATWRRTAIRVGQGRCGQPNTAHLVADLDPL